MPPTIPDTAAGSGTHADPEPHCVLEVWDTGRRVWMADTVAHRTIAEATAAALERGVYRVVLVSHGRRLEMDVFAVVGASASATEPQPRDMRTKNVGSSGHIR